SLPSHLSTHLFLSSYAAHRYLHAFPTRRSSDLEDVSLETAVRLMAEMAGLRSVRMSNVMFVTAKAPAAELKADTEANQPVLPPIDRKSTRLNSSHGSISYAVFCLKKKRNKHYRL